MNSYGSEDKLQNCSWTNISGDACNVVQVPNHADLILTSKAMYVLCNSLFINLTLHIRNNIENIVFVIFLCLHDLHMNSKKMGVCVKINYFSVQIII